jgi:uncharacterized protein (TIGR03437 family)
MAPGKNARIAQLTALGIALPILLLAFSSGPDAGDSGVPGEESCAGCHNGPPGQGSVAVAFPAGATYSPGVKQHLVVTITDPAQQRWGFQLTARLASSLGVQAGTFTPSADGYTQLVCTQANFRSQVFGSACASNGLPLEYIEHTRSGTRMGAKSPVTFEFDWTPPATNSGNLVVYVTAVAANGDNSDRGDHTYSARYALTPPGVQPEPPAITSAVNAASFQQDVSAGSWVTIFGTNLAGITRAWTAADFNGPSLPTQLDGVGVKIDGKPAYVGYISPGQINVQAPADSSLGPVPVEVTNNGVTSPSGSVHLQPSSPAFFVWNRKYAVATHTDFSPASTAQPGEIIILWGTGFGATSPVVAPGVLPPASTVASVASNVTVTIGNLPATILGAALAPGNAGLYQIAIQIPASIAEGDQPVAAQVAGIQSAANILLAIKR